MLPPLYSLAAAQLRRLASPAEMAAMDKHAIEHYGIPSRLLMENAAAALAQLVCAKLKRMRPAHKNNTSAVVFCCGTGNNGGDGYAAARLTVNHGEDALVIALDDPSTPEAQANAALWKHFGQTLSWQHDRQLATQALNQAPLLVDALFGTGLKRPLNDSTLELVQIFNQAPAPFKLAVDIPSGIDGFTGSLNPAGAACRCDATLCFQVAKPGLYQPPGLQHAGHIRIAAVSIPAWWQPDAPPLLLLTPKTAAPLLPTRDPMAHKASFGRVFCICGSQGMAGAAMLAGQAASRSGAGLVTLGVPPALLDCFIQQAPELMTSSPPQSSTPHCFQAQDATHFLDLSMSGAPDSAASPQRALVIGCGLGQASGTREFVRSMLISPLPLVLDADALNALDLISDSSEDARLLQQRSAATVLTPHAGEFARLFGVDKDHLAANRIACARSAAQGSQAVVILKGAATVIASPNGTALLNTSGDEGLATAGSGDVLSGMLGSLLAQGMSALSAAALGVSWHGLARDLQQEQIASSSFTASMLLEGLLPAARWLEASKQAYASQSAGKDR